VKEVSDSIGYEAENNAAAMTLQNRGMYYSTGT